VASTIRPWEGMKNLQMLTNLKKRRPAMKVKYANKRTLTTSTSKYNANYNIEDG
jgi:hypothetical protein